MESARPLVSRRVDEIDCVERGPGEPVDDWLRGSREALHALLAERGALLFRGCALSSADDFERFAFAFTDERWRGNPNLFSPRSPVSGAIYTSTGGYVPSEEARDHRGPRAPLHSEFSHSLFRVWPTKLFFFCDAPPLEGGQTPVADARWVFDHLPAALRDRFTSRKLLYTRVLYADVAGGWRQVFGTADHREVEAVCARNAVAHEWLEGGLHLRMRWKLHAAIRHAASGRMVWFNQANTVAFDALPEEVRRSYVDLYGADGRPMDVTYADGGRIDPEDLVTINGVFERAARSFHWARGDVMVVDNTFMAHGRSPFRGGRRVWVCMAGEQRTTDVETF